VYGTIDATPTVLILTTMMQHTSMDRDSVMVDLGSGLNRPNLIAAVYVGIRRAVGYEYDGGKVEKAVRTVPNTLETMLSSGVHNWREPGSVLYTTPPPSPPQP
jgi:hypothetical protein